MTDEQTFQPSHHRFSRYGPLVIWAALIFLFSSSLMSASKTGTILRPVVLWIFPQTSEATLALLHFLLRKIAHFTEYAILAILAARAFRTSSRDFLKKRWFLTALLFVILYALSDEFHQSFVTSRTASIYDGLIDSTGGLFGLLIAWLTGRRHEATGATSSGAV